MNGCAATREDAARRPWADGAAAALPNFDELYDAYVDFVWRSARRLGVSPAALDDVIQDVFLIAHRRLDSVEKVEALRSWMYGVVIRVVRDHRRGLRRKPGHGHTAVTDCDASELPDPRGTDPLAAFEQSDAVRMLHRVLGELPDAKREVFVLAELEELSELEISEILGESVHTVHSRLRAARKAFELAVTRHRSRDEWRLR
jgi:RNA polymerase sigma-70 factor (ECF subfamily)